MAGSFAMPLAHGPPMLEMLLGLVRNYSWGTVQFHGSNMGKIAAHDKMLLLPPHCYRDETWVT